MIDLTAARIRGLCIKYEEQFRLFSVPRIANATRYMAFAREIAEEIGYMSSGGDE